jgi:hypothetical protein
MLGQHKSPWKPQRSQAPSTQILPGPPQSSPAQQGSPTAPHAAHVPSWQMKSGRQSLPSQQGSAKPPQSAQEPSTQISPPSAQVLPTQHGWSKPPQFSQVPPLPLSAQIWSGSVQQQTAPFGETRQLPPKRQVHCPPQHISVPPGLHGCRLPWHCPSMPQQSVPVHPTHTPLPSHWPHGTVEAQLAPAALFVGGEQVPLAGSQVPATWHALAAGGQVTGVPAPQAPLRHAWVHLLPHRVPLVVFG